MHQDIISLFLHSQRKNAVVTGDGISRRRRWRKRRGQEERAQEVYCINSSNLGGALIPRRAAPRRAALLPCHRAIFVRIKSRATSFNSTRRPNLISHLQETREARHVLDRSIDRSIERRWPRPWVVDGIWRTILAQFLCSTIHAELQTWCCLGWGASLVLAHFTMITKANKNTKLLNCIGVNKTVIRVRPTDRIFFFR